METNPRREFFFSVLIFLLVILSIKGLITVLSFVGYVSYLQAEGGTVTEIDIKASYDVSHWSALYGTGFGVGFTSEWSFNLTGNTTLNDVFNERHMFFTCFEPSVEHELYASMRPEDEIDFNTLVAAATSDYDAYMNIAASSFYSASNTFTQTATFDVGGTLISTPSTYTYSYNSVNSTTFVTGILKDDDNNLVLVTKLLDSPVDGFQGDRYNYQLLLPIQNTTYQNYYIWSDPTDECPAGEGVNPFTGYVFGNVTDTNGNPLGEVIIEITGQTNLSLNNTGEYTVYNIPEGNNSVFAMKTGYRVYRNSVIVLRGNGTAHNIVMVAETPPNPPLTGIGPGQDNPGDSTQDDVGPGESDHTKDGDFDIPPVIQKPKTIEGTDYIVSINEINRKIRLGNFLQEKVTLYSFKERAANIEFKLEGNVSHLIKLDKEAMVLDPRSSDFVTLTMFGVQPTGIYNGSLVMDGDFNVTIPITIEVLPSEKLPVEALLIDLEVNDRVTYPGREIKIKTDLKNLLTDLQYPVALFISIQDIEGKKTLWTYETNVFMRTSMSLIKSAIIPKDAKAGDYIVRVSASYLGLSSSTSTIFRIKTPWYLITLFGPIRVWHIVLFLILIAIGFGVYWHIKQKIESKKKFHLKVELNELPKLGPRSIPVGKIAETETKTYFNMEAFMTHCIVAGSTGSGKSVSAQVIVEEMLLKGNVAVIVFDPTAQWTGMLRKCTDKTLLALYPFYGMKPTDARAFNGNIRQISNPRELLEIRKYVKPGEIQVFACHKLEPKEMDMFVANTIRQIFRANFEESRALKILFVYDEVHRLLPKFGGSGEGFLQIERGCREFRKWGLGILLISQVLSDFVGTIKANINTEIQMRTRDEGDLERIRVKYGEEVLRSLVKATVGSGMVENPGYNRGKPYFVAFRPLMHSVARLGDDEIQKYNDFNEKIDQLMYELDCLEKEGLDVFDLKLELKLAVDKVKTGSFNMVQIYIEGLEPRIKKNWEKIGKQPPKLEKKLVTEAELAADLAKAKADREVAEAEAKKNAPAGGEKKDVDLFKKDVPPDKLMKLNNGMIVINLASLFDEITAMKDPDYDFHVTPLKNDFADWIRSALGENELADAILYAENKAEILSILEAKKAKKPIEKPSADKIKKWEEKKAAALAPKKEEKGQQPPGGAPPAAGAAPATAPAAPVVPESPKPVEAAAVQPAAKPA